MNLPFKVQEFKPIPELAPYVHRWVFLEYLEAEKIKHKVPPSGTVFMNHAFKCKHHKVYKNNREYTYESQTVFFGHPLSYDVEIELYKGLSQVVCEFKPEGLYPLLHFDVDQLIDAEIGIEYFGFGDLAASLVLGESKEEVRKMMESFLLDRLKIVKVIEPEVLQLIIGLSKFENTTFESFQNLSDSKRKQIYRKFKKYLGLSPKQFYRITQLNLVVRLLNEQDFNSLTDLGLKAGYYDQSAFIKHLKSVINKSPSWLLNNRDELLFQFMGGPTYL